MKRLIFWQRLLERLVGMAYGPLLLLGVFTLSSLVVQLIPGAMLMPPELAAGWRRVIFVMGVALGLLRPFPARWQWARWQKARNRRES